MNRFKVKLTYTDTGWNPGATYAEGCEMCQPEGAGTYRMLMLPTTLVRLEHDGASREVRLCKSCIDRGIKAGTVEATRNRPGARSRWANLIQ